MRSAPVKPLALAVLLASGLCFCAEGPTAPDVPDMERYVACHAEALGLGDVELAYRDLPEGQACGAWPGADYITCDPEWVQGATPEQREYAVAHEACHLAGHWEEPPVPCLYAAAGRCL